MTSTEATTADLLALANQAAQKMRDLLRETTTPTEAIAVGAVAILLYELLDGRPTSRVELTIPEHLRDSGPFYVSLNVGSPITELLELVRVRPDPPTPTVH